MRRTLAKLDAWLAASRPGLLPSLRPGLDHGQLADVGDALRTGLNTPLRLLWQWHDGQEPSGETFVHNRSLMTTEDAIRTATMLQDMFRSSPQWWGPRWIPFLHNGAGDHICVDLGGDTPRRPRRPAPRRGQVVEFRHDDSTRLVLAPSLEAWLEALMASWSQCPWTLRGGMYALPLDDNGRAWNDHQAVMRDALPGYPVRYTVSRAT